MRVFILFILFVASGSASGQAKKLNELFNKYAFNEYAWDKHPPMALQSARELMVADFITLDTIFVIKWADIDSVKIADTRKGNVNIVVYGKVIKYQKCTAADTCNAKYADIFYHAAGLTDKIRIPLQLKTHDGKLIFSKKIRKEFKKSFRQLGHIPVVEQYNPTPSSSAVFDSQTKEIAIYRTYYSEETTFIAARNLRKAKRIVIHFLTFKIVSFDLYVIVAGKTTKISNQGPAFNDKKLLRSLRQGAILIFDEVKVDVGQGEIRTPISFALVAN